MTTTTSDSGFTLSTHVLDTALGAPASGVKVWLEAVAPDGNTRVVGRAVTDGDGRVRAFAGAGATLSAGVYRLHFDTDGYFHDTAREGFFPDVTIAFRAVSGSGHYHLPLLLNPYGYTTYRGS